MEDASVLRNTLTDLLVTVTRQQITLNVHTESQQLTHPPLLIMNSATWSSMNRVVLSAKFPILL